VWMSDDSSGMLLDSCGPGLSADASTSLPQTYRLECNSDNVYACRERAAVVRCRHQPLLVQVSSMHNL
jgi:hypothetical protein